MSCFAYWGKAEKEGSAYHLLPYHCLDVAAVGWLLLDPGKPLCRCLAAQLEIAPELLQKWLAFLFSLHDIGKFANAFQGLAPDLSSDLVQKNTRMEYTIRHDTLGYILWREGLKSSLEEAQLFSNSPDVRQLGRTLDVLMQVVTGHHGIPPKNITNCNFSNHFTKQDEEAALQFVLAAYHLFLSKTGTATFSDKDFTRRLKLSSWAIAGVVVLADWLGSSRPVNTYLHHKINIDEYWSNHALPHARQAVAMAQLDASPVTHYLGVEHLFPFINSLTPLQQWASTVELADTNQLFILEDVTGAGKTEAALTLTHRLMANGFADGIYVALPTMATANAMYERLGKVYRRLYAADAFPSLVLAHGARHLSDAFRTSLNLPENQKSRRCYGKDEEAAEVYCNVWLSDSRKKALLADVGIGTIDQALLAVLPAKHQSLRCLGLVRKILIVDEVHSFDPYMNHLLQKLIKYHATQGGSIILLSATLPHSMRSSYLRAFAEGMNLEEPRLQLSESYPLATHFPSSSQIETEVATRKEVERTVAIVLLDSVEQTMDVIRKAVEQGKCVCWVRNTVGDATKAFRQLKKQAWLDTERLSLFHSRFAMIDRQRIETATLEQFGKESTAEMRRGRILIATQVVEQSLDLDFDVMISDIAPIDLIIQRAGREHRHIRDADGNRIATEGATDKREAPVFYLLGPPATNEPQESWLKDVLPGTQAVYQHVGQLWLTQQALGATGRLCMPGDARNLIEGVYGDEAQKQIPEALAGLTWKALGEDSGKLSMANLNALNTAKGYCNDSSTSGGWADEAKIPTRLGDDSVRIALVVADGEEWLPYANVEEYAWDLSMVSVPKWRWQKAKELIAADIQTSLSTLKEEKKFLEWTELFPLTAELSAWYDEQMGWGLYKEDANESD